MGHLHEVLLLTLSALASASSFSSTQNLRSSSNPVRRVITILESMQKKVQAEGVKDKEVHEKYMTFCASDTLEKEVSGGSSKISQLETDVKEMEEKQGQLEADMEQYKKDRAAAEKNIAEANAIREKDAAENLKDITEKKKNLAALEKAIKALQKGTGNFLQTSTAVLVQKIASDMDLSSSSRDVLNDFFTQKSADGYEPASDQIIGIMKQMKEEMEKDLADVQAAESEAQLNHRNMVQAKQKEVEACNSAMQEKTQRLGDLGVDLMSLKENLDDTKSAFEQNGKFLADKKANCANEEKLWEEKSKTRQEELVAISSTIKILNDDDALELFKKTIPSTSLLQMQVSVKVLKQKVLAALQSRQYRDARLDLIALAVHGGKKVSFEKVLTMIDDMVQLLEKEQSQDDTKKQQCEDQLDENEDKLKNTENEAHDLEKALDEEKSMLEAAGDEVAAITNGINDLDQQVAQATSVRKQEHENYEASLSENKAAKDLLLFAKNRLNKFYNPKLYMAPAKEEAAQQDAPVLMEVSSHMQLEGPPPPPAGTTPYKAQHADKVGVTQMLDMIVADIDKEMKAQEVEEKSAQTDYESFVKDSANKRAADSQSLEDRVRAKSDLEVELQKMKVMDKSKLKEAYATTLVLQELHKDCDWLLSNHKTRKVARTSEIDSLKKAKAVLSGMDAL